MTYTRPQGAYYVMIDISEFGWDDDTAFNEWLAREDGVAGITGIELLSRTGKTLNPISFRQQTPTLQAAGERLLNLRKRATGSVCD